MGYGDPRDLGYSTQPSAYILNFWIMSCCHYSDIKMGAMASQITSFTIVYSAVYSRTYERKHQISASLAFVREIPRGPVNSPHKWPVTRKMFPFDDVIMAWQHQAITWTHVEKSSVRLCGIHLRANSQQVLKLLFCILSVKIILLESPPYLPGSNESKTTKHNKARDIGTIWPPLIKETSSYW